MTDRDGDLWWPRRWTGRARGAAARGGLAATRGRRRHLRRRRVGDGDRRRAAQGPPPRRRRTRLRRLGRADAAPRSTGSRSRRSASSPTSTASPPRGDRCAPVRGTCVRPLVVDDAAAVNEAALQSTSTTAPRRCTSHLSEAPSSSPGRAAGRAARPGARSPSTAPTRAGPRRWPGFSRTARRPAPRQNLSADLQPTALLPGERAGDDGGTARDLSRPSPGAASARRAAPVVDGTALHDDRGQRRPGARLGHGRPASLPPAARRRRLLRRRGGGLIEFRYAATDEQFPTIAKLRAARRLWARVLEASGAGDRQQRRTRSRAAR